MNKGISRLVRAVTGAMVSTVALLAFAQPAMPATGNVRFFGNINSASTCAVIVNNNGTLGISPNVRQLSSKIAGGLAGRVTILQAGVYSISATTLPNFIVAPIGGDTGVTRQVLVDGTATNLVTGFSLNIPERNGSPGFTVNSFGMASRVNLNVNFIANRPTSFPSGPYRALVVVRCE